MRIVSISVLMCSLCAFFSYADGGKTKDSAFAPFYFKTGTLGNTIGVAGVVKGVGQPQAALFGFGLYSDTDSYITFFSAFNYALAPSLLFSTQMYRAHFNESPYYLGIAGNNSSPSNSQTITNGYEQKYKFEFKYLLPWGAIEEHGLYGAFISNREVSYQSPLKSGVSSIQLTPYYSSRTLDVFDDIEQAYAVALSLDWDNRDNSRNPTKGSHTAMSITTGSKNWTPEKLWLKWELQNSQYYPLGPLYNFFNQQVFAFDFYLADTPTWNEYENTTYSRPPEQEQVRLGGLYRLRGYNGGRYHGRSAVHYSMEYRAIPNWQPLGNIPFINYYDLSWWQWVAFADLGRVADEFSLNTLHEDMRWSLGGAVRFQVEGVVVRAEVAKGVDEGTLRVMINHPF
ncbi:Surface antigen [Vibrio alginolyticus]|uniref:Surface antigen n=1 Tax=Vibrio alginolyticus TaxID=663 RepID=A0A1W6TS94_VIBAL|nr:Surface antigen [Vibrio alginolyticus]ARP03495.1 Surface antigen [Vibrio alginolyticus]ARP08553.1 Surface antigen [Vibrio alginolyticus]ARP13628.1 Surface antigen [Vibrio alginolyticus]ARP18688.1 Surface antigen [Vibrio alginolyticus]